MGFIWWSLNAAASVQLSGRVRREEETWPRGSGEAECHGPQSRQGELDSAVAERFNSQEKFGSAELLCSCGIQHGKRKNKVNADAASLVFWGAGEQREGV